MLSLGLSNDRTFVSKFLQSSLTKNDKLEILTLKKFLKVFEYDKFRQQAFQLLIKEFNQLEQIKLKQLKNKLKKCNLDEDVFEEKIPELIEIVAILRNWFHSAAKL